MDDLNTVPKDDIIDSFAEAIVIDQEYHKKLRR